MPDFLSRRRIYHLVINILILRMKLYNYISKLYLEAKDAGTVWTYRTWIITWIVTDVEYDYIISVDWKLIVAGRRATVGDNACRRDFFL